MRTIWVTGLVVVVGCTNVAAPPPPIANTPAVAVATRARLAVGAGDYGTAHPMYLRSHDTVGQRWMALCQARSDTDGDGQVEVSVGHHGALYGDAVELYLVIGGGPGTPIEALVHQSWDDRWVAILRGGKLELVDVTTGELWELEDADVASDGRPGAAHRAAKFVGERLVYIRHRAAADVLVVHELARHTEREVPVKDRVWRITDGGRLAQVYTIPRGQPFPRLRTTLDAGECLGEARSYSKHGQDGPRPTERWIDLERGVEVAAPPKSMNRDPSIAHTPQLSGEALGPARWPPPSLTR